jgi:hypothetical protein
MSLSRVGEADPASDLRAVVALEGRDIVVVWQVDPELCPVAEIAAEARTAVSAAIDRRAVTSSHGIHVRRSNQRCRRGITVGDRLAILAQALPDRRMRRRWRTGR